MSETLLCDQTPDQVVTSLKRNEPQCFPNVASQTLASQDMSYQDKELWG